MEIWVLFPNRKQRKKVRRGEIENGCGKKYSGHEKKKYVFVCFTVGTSSQKHIGEARPKESKFHSSMDFSF